MIYIRDEAERIRTGFNFYPLGSNHIGFIVAWGAKRIWQIRYSKVVGLLWIGQRSFKVRG
jgi:hypothetical protein